MLEETVRALEEQKEDVAHHHQANENVSHTHKAKRKEIQPLQAIGILTQWAVVWWIYREDPIIS